MDLDPFDGDDDLGVNDTIDAFTDTLSSLFDTFTPDWDLSFDAADPSADTDLHSLNSIGGTTSGLPNDGFYQSLPGMDSVTGEMLDDTYQLIDDIDVMGEEMFGAEEWERAGVIAQSDPYGMLDGIETPAAMELRFTQENAAAEREFRDWQAGNTAVLGGEGRDPRGRPSDLRQRVGLVQRQPSASPRVITLADVKSALETSQRQSHEIDGRLVVALPDARHQLWVDLDDGGRSLCVQLRSADRIARSLWPRVLAELDSWNRTERLAKAFLTADDWSTAESATVVTEVSLPLAADVDPEVIPSVVDLTAAAGARCRRHLAQGLARQ